MFIPSVADMFDRTRLESAAATLGGMGVAADRSALDAARQLLELGVGPMAAGCSATSLFQVQPRAAAQPNPVARAIRLEAWPDVVQFSMQAAAGPGDDCTMAIVWFNLEGLCGGEQPMILCPGISSVRVATGRGGVVAAIYGPGERPGFVYLR